MIIFGTKGVTSTRQKGEFSCPECGPGQEYAHKAVRKFFTLYFIPMIPLNQLGEFIECRRCKGTYHLRVLEHQPEQQAANVEAHFQTGARKIMIGMLLADGVIDDEEVDALRKIYTQITNKEIGEDALRQEIAAMQQASTGVEAIVNEMRGYLNPEGIEMIVRAAYMIALSDGEFHESEQLLLWEIGRGLGMTQTHFKALLTEVNESLPPA